MAQAVKYKKPRRFNSVTIGLLVIAGLTVFFAYQYLPLFLQKQEAFRVLEETGSAFAGRRSYYLADPKAAEALRRRMEADMRRVGVQDPELETWIEFEEHAAEFGAVYSVFIEWPFQVVPKQEFVYQVEHVVKF